MSTNNNDSNDRGCGCLLLLVFLFAGIGWVMRTQMIEDKGVTREALLSEAADSIILSPPDVSDKLDRIWRLPAEETANIAVTLADVAFEPVEASQFMNVLQGVAWEKADDTEEAYLAYQQVIAEGPDTPYGNTAAFRLQFLKRPDNAQNLWEHIKNWFYNRQRSSQNREDIYATILRNQDNAGWFLLNDQWVWTTARQVTAKQLIPLRQDTLSFRFFQFLREQSPWPLIYAHLFILLVLTIGTRILTFPLSLKTVTLQAKLQRLKPRIQMLEHLYSNEPQLKQQELSTLYAQKGLNPFSGCAVGIVDLIFVVGTMVMLSNFEPQFLLDSASLWWITDITQRDLGTLIIWSVIGVVQASLTQQSIHQRDLTAMEATSGLLLTFLIVIAIAWFARWPAYIFVFWILLASVGLVVQKLLATVSPLFVR